MHGNTSHNSTTVTVPHDAGKSITRITPAMNEETPVDALSIKILNNPSRNYFTLLIQTNKPDKMNVRLFDVYGRMVESKTNLAGSQALRIGSDLKAGFYLVELIQGQQKKQLKLLKLK